MKKHKVFIVLVSIVSLILCYFCIEFFFLNQRIIMCENKKELSEYEVTLGYLTTDDDMFYDTYIWGDKFKKTSEKVISRIKLQYIVNHMFDKNKENYYNSSGEEMVICKNVFVYHDEELGIFIMNCVANDKVWKIVVNASNGDVIYKHPEHYLTQ
ncbi:MAG: hypothetical protein J6A69_03765 [Clostridia bacterium]|nr:hypothetical protein [Clostridia bacterium]